MDSEKSINSFENLTIPKIKKFLLILLFGKSIFYNIKSY